LSLENKLSLNKAQINKGFIWKNKENHIIEAQSIKSLLKRNKNCYLHPSY